MYRILVEALEEKTSLKKPRYRPENDVKIIIEE
jgi:hypothetical protein